MHRKNSLFLQILSGYGFNVHYRPKVFDRLLRVATFDKRDHGTCLHISMVQSLLVGLNRSSVFIDAFIIFFSRILGAAKRLSLSNIPVILQFICASQFRSFSVFKCLETVVFHCLTEAILHCSVR